MYQVLLFKSRRHLCKGSMGSLFFPILVWGSAWRSGRRSSAINTCGSVPIAMVLCLAALIRSSAISQAQATLVYYVRWWLVVSGVF